MKPRDIQRSVKSLRFDRSAGDAPSMGRVSRVPGTGRAKGTRRRRRKDHEGRGERGNRHRRNRHRVIVAWSATFVLIALAAMAAAIWFWTADNMNRGVTVVADKSDAGRERVESKFPSPPREVALDFVKRALKVRSAEEVATYFRPGLHKPGEIIGFLNTWESAEGTDAKFMWVSSVDANGLLIDGVEVYSQKEEDSKYRIALLTPDEKGRWLMDFEAFARPMSPPWKEFLAGNQAEATVRVLIRADHYFNGKFNDETAWSCFRMDNLEMETPMYGYCAVNSPQAKALREILSKSVPLAGQVSSQRVTLKIVRPTGAERSQFEIQRVIAEDWIVTERAFDEGYH